MAEHSVESRTTTARIVELESDVAETVRVVLEVEDDHFSFLAGQWLNLGVQLDGELKVGGYSFASAPGILPRFELGIRDSERNPVSRYFHRGARVGAEVVVDGGHGPCFYHPDDDIDLVLVAGGIGLTPMLSIARAFQASASHRTLRLFYSASMQRGFAFRDAVLSLESDARMKVELIETGTDAQGRMDVASLAELNNGKTAYYLCGPTGMVDQLSVGLALEGIPEGHIRFEKWW